MWLRSLPTNYMIGFFRFCAVVSGGLNSGWVARGEIVVCFTFVRARGSFGTSILRDSCPHFAPAAIVPSVSIGAPSIPVGPFVAPSVFDPVLSYAFSAACSFFNPCCEGLGDILYYNFHSPTIYIIWCIMDVVQVAEKFPNVDLSPMILLL